MIALPLDDAAKLQAIAEIYPRRSIDEIISELLSAALHDVEQSLLISRVKLLSR